MDFDYTQLPQDYALCPHTACPRAAQCLRQALYNDVPGTLTYIRILSPAAARRAAGAQCPHYRSAETRRFAQGIDALLEQLRTFSYNDAVWIKREIFRFFGKWMYYQIKNRHRLVTPEDQEAIRKIYRSKGIDAEPTFDLYIDKYDFRND